MPAVLITVQPADADAPVRPGDWDQDGAITVHDVAALSACLVGPHATPVAPCLVFDADGDGDVDLRDFHHLQCAVGMPPIPGDWNGDGYLWVDDLAGGYACVGGPQVPVAPTCGIMDLDADGDVDLADLAAFTRAVPHCGLTPDNWEPADWFDTDTDNSLQPADSLFRLMCLDGRPAFGTVSTAPNIHSHFVGPGAAAWSGYTYTGRMRLTDPAGGVGVTFYSDYPNSDHYYRLRSWVGQAAFHIAPHGAEVVLSGDTDSGVVPSRNVWYAFRIEVRNAPTETVIRANVWHDGAPEPAGWQIECADTRPNRYTSGTIGVWAMGPGAKYWDGLQAVALPCGVDVDSDGVPDCADACPTDPAKTVPGACGCLVADADADEDGIPNCQDQCPGVADVDTDSDGLADCVDGCPNDPDKTAPQVCGCGTPDADADFDDVPDCIDADNICLTTHELNFGTEMTLQGLYLWSCDGNPLNYSVVSKPFWLSLSPASGSSNGEDVLMWASVSRGALAPARYAGKVVIRDLATGKEAWITATVNKTVLTPIARWDVVPRQRINAGETLNCGVVAFSKAGIDRVRFSISGAGYTGPSPIDVTVMTLNPRVNVWEYWIPISASDFTADGLVTIQATVIGNDGGVRDATTIPGTGLEPLELFINRYGSRPANVAWVDVAGNDASGAVNNPNRPFARISTAMQALATYQNGNADGALVRLRPGAHEADNGGIFLGETAATEHEWITITNDPAVGGSAANTAIDRKADSSLTSDWLAVRGLTLSGAAIINGGSSSDPDLRKRRVWLKDCIIIGGPESRPFPVGSNWIGPHYYTECFITGQRRASGNGQNQRLMRNLTITENREDVFQAVPCGINIFVDGVDPGDGPNPEHADVIQSSGAVQGNAASMHNWIFYNVVATDLHYQALFTRTGAPALDNAFVNCLFEMRDPVRVGGIGSAMAGMYDHLLVWNCSFIGTGTQHETALGRPEALTIPGGSWLMANVSVRGCLIDRYVCDVGGALFTHDDVEFRDNHYNTPAGIGNSFTPDTTGGTITVGDPQIVTDVQSPDFGAPASAASPLVDRIGAPPVPADARGTPRGAAADVGALER
ncbi:MAG: hypothetical protein H6816_09600 [Phycisphaerales bacterium]|nr:hypothetical protein [Phycisphaerales bacterium]